MTRYLRITVNLELDTTPICGLVITDTHPDRPFRGWLELASAIEQLRSAALATAQARVESQPIETDVRKER